MATQPHALDDDIRRYVLDDRARVVSDFDQANATALDETLSDIRRALSFMRMSAIFGEMGIPRFHALALTKTSLDVIISALQMARQRAIVETFTLLRVALEAACTSRQILTDEIACEQYLAGRYESTRSIGSMKSDIPCVPKLWGVFGKACVHTNVAAYGPSYQVQPDGSATATVHVGSCEAQQREPREDACSLAAVSLVAAILLKVLERNSTECDAGCPGWLRLVGTSLLYCHSTDAGIARRYELFCKLLGRGDT